MEKIGYVHRNCLCCRQQFFDDLGEQYCEDCRADNMLTKYRFDKSLSPKLDITERTKTLKRLIKYLSGAVFDKATGDEWKKTCHFHKLINDAEKELHDLIVEFNHGKF